MKAQKILNILLMVLIILLISIISFVGIYVQKQANMKNVIPDYKLGINLKGYRAISLDIKEEVDLDDNKDEDEASNEIVENITETSETTENQEATNEVTQEADGNATNETEETTKVATSEDIAKYERSANILRKRLKKLGVEDYTVTVDRNTGKVDITIPENDATDTIISDITQIGKFKIVDADTKETLITNDDIRSVSITTQNSGTDSKGEPITYIYMTINFNLEGSSKFAALTKKYQNIVSENETNGATEDIANELQTETEEPIENVTNEVEESEEAETEETSGPKQVTLKIDDTDLMTTYFSTINDSGSLSLTVGNSSSSVGNFDTMIIAAENLAAIMENDPLNYQYDVNTNVYVNTTLDSNKVKLMVYIEIAIALLIALVVIAKYRTNGVAAAISSVGFVGLLLLAIRFGNVVLSLEGLFTIEIAYIINMIYNILLLNRLKKENLTSKERMLAYKESMQKYLFTLIPLAIIIIAFTMMSSWGTLNSIGLVLFLGGAISCAYNAIVSYVYIRATNKQ